MRILFLCNKSPWPPKEGGPIAMDMLIQGMADAGHSVKVLAVNSHKYYTDPADIPAGYLARTGLELIPMDIRLKPFPALLSLIRGNSYHITRFRTAAFAGRLAEILKEKDYDVVQLETLTMASYIDVIRANSKAAIVLRAHNLEHLIWARVASNTGNPLRKLYLRHASLMLKKFETEAASLVDGIAAITGKDASFFRTLTSRPVTAVPFGVAPDDYPVSRMVRGMPRLFIIGAMNWIPNQEGVEWFLKNVWPDLHKRFPGLEFHIAGREMPPRIQNLDMPNVIVEGEVESAADFYASNDIMVVPLFSGSGIRIKIIEAMAYGKTVVSTSIGAEGIDYTNGENMLVADAACEFFDMISVCVENPALLEKTGHKARELVESSYDRKKITDGLLAFYAGLGR